MSLPALSKVKMSFERQLTTENYGKFENGHEKARSEKHATQGQCDQADPVVDRRVTRLFDLHILPWLFGIWWGYLCMLKDIF